jgi:hypothetical protein
MSTGMRSRADLGVGRVYHRQILFPGARGTCPTPHRLCAEGGKSREIPPYAHTRRPQRTPDAELFDNQLRRQSQRRRQATASVNTGAWADTT